MNLKDIIEAAKDYKADISVDNEELIELTPKEFNTVLKTHQELQTIENRLEYQHNDLIHNNLNITLRIIFVIFLTGLFYVYGGRI